MINYIKHLNDVVKLDNNNTTEVILISEIMSTINQLETVCKNQQYRFRNMKGWLLLKLVIKIIS